MAVDDGVPVFLGDLVRGLAEVAARQPGVVDEDVAWPHAFGDPCKKPGHLGALRDIRRESLRIPAGGADGSRRLLGPAGVDPVDRHARAFLREQPGFGQPDAPAGASDEHHLAGKTQVHAIDTPLPQAYTKRPLSAN